MDTESIILITKDALCKEYLPVYGNKYWSGKTPNIDELVKKGTVFNRHYTAAPSTVMAFRAMVTGQFAYEQPYSNYTPKEVDPVQGNLFERATENGYESHLVWDASWQNMVLRYGDIYRGGNSGDSATIHNMFAIKQGVGCHYKHNGTLVADEKKVRETIDKIYEEIKGILNKGRKSFVWLHLPHVINGRTAYGGDIDALDDLVGKMRALFADDNIFISADHGNMNGHNGKFCYGFDLNTSAIEIPLISPKINAQSVCNDITSNVDIKTLIFDRKIVHREYVLADSAYYIQPHRKLAIVKGDFAYIYNKADKTEELYDLQNDRDERINLLKKENYDTDRQIKSPVCDYYFSPYWDKTEELLIPFREIRVRIWRNGTWLEEFREKYLRKLKAFVVKIKVNFK